MKVRIVERTHPDGKVEYVIQQKHLLLRWQWVDAWINSMGAMCRDTFPTRKEAEDNLCWFDGTKRKDEVVVCK